MQEENKNSNDLFQVLPPDQRTQALKDNAYSIEEQTVCRAYTGDEIRDFKDKLSEDSVDLQKIKAEYDEISKKFKARMKPLEVSIKENTKNIRLGYSETLEEVYLMADHVESVMTTVDKDGKFISSRRLNPKEKQLQTAYVRNEGTNG